MPRIACLMMLRDEALLLKPWLVYHSYLFGLENLYVYDNGSSNESVLATLRQFSAIGVNVDLKRNTMADFKDKGEIIGDKIKQFRESGRYDIAIACDCDEFVAIAGETGPSISKTEILNEIARIHEGGAVCRTNRCLYNVPGYLDQFTLQGHWKSIVPVATFRGIDHGFHRAHVPDGEAYGATSLTYVHLQHKPFEQVVAGARQKLSAFTDITDLEGLRTYDGVGRHLVKYLLMTPEEYYAMRPEGLPFIRFTGFLRFLEVFMDITATRAAWESGRPVADGKPAVIGLDETPFSAAAYLAANSDLEGVANLFYHYVEQGFAESRPLWPVADIREAALRAMAENRHDDAVRLWAEFRALVPDDRDGYDFALVACRNARRDPDDIIIAGLSRFSDYLAFAEAEAEMAPPARAALLREAIRRLAVMSPA
jgi:hypothetical protein